MKAPRLLSGLVAGAFWSGPINGRHWRRGLCRDKCLTNLSIWAFRRCVSALLPHPRTYYHRSTLNNSLLSTIPPSVWCPLASCRDSSLNPARTESFGSPSSPSLISLQLYSVPHRNSHQPSFRSGHHWAASWLFSSNS